MTTTNMGLIQSTPGVGGTSGPLWASNIEYNFERLDAHDHTLGNGAPIVASALNIDDDFSFNGFNATDFRSVRLTNFASTGVFAATSDDASCLFSIAGELYYRDQAGNSVPITSAGGLAGTPGSIGGLVNPREIAIDVFGAGDNMWFTADTATHSGLNLIASGISLAAVGAGGMLDNKITIKAPAGPTSYNITVPAAPPSSSYPVVMSSVGVLSATPITASHVDSVVKQYVGGNTYNAVTLTVTATPSSGVGTVRRAVFVPYKTSDGAYRVQMNITVTGNLSATSCSISVAGLSFKSFAGATYHRFPVALPGSFGQGTAAMATGIIGITNYSGGSTEWNVHTELELDSKPTWMD